MDERDAAAREHLAAYALGALDHELACAEVEAWLARDAAARAELVELRGASDLLVFASPRAVPSPAVWDAIQARITADARRTRHSSGARWYALAALVLALLSGALGWRAWQLERELANARAAELAQLARLDARRVVALEGTGAPGSRGRLLVAADGSRAELVVTGLAPLASERTYQLWFKRGSDPVVSGGVFQVDERGAARLSVTLPAPIDELVAIAVTNEPGPGVPKPTGAHLLDLVR